MYYLIKMIVTYTDSGFEIVLQRHHGKLAGILLNQLEWLKTDPFKFDVLLATAEHDDAYNEFEVEGVISRLKGPKDFKMESFNRGRCDALLKKGFTKSLYLALLMSHHIQFLYAEESKESAAYCKSLQLLQQKWAKELGLKMDKVQTNYNILQWCNALSLILCQSQIPPEGRKLEISKGPQSRSYFIFSQPDDNRVSVDPWPFVDDDFELNLEFRVLPSLAYESDNTVRRALWDAPVHLRKISFAKLKSGSNG